MNAGGLKGALLALLDFSDWVDERIWSCVERLEAAQFTQPLEYSVGSIRDQLAHMLGAERVWLARMQGEETPPEWRDYTQFPDQTYTQDAAKQTRMAFRDYVVRLSETAIREYYHWPPYDHGRDDPASSRWLTLLHVVNHGTDHRSQILLQLARHFDAATLAIDLSRYWRQRRSPVHGLISVNIIRCLFAYHRWAMERVWNFAAVLTDEAFRQPLDYSVGSIQQQLVHILNAERYWLRRMGAPAVPSLVDMESYSQPKLKAIADEQEQWKRDWLAGLDDAAMARWHSFHHPDSKARLSWAKWQVLLHVLNHSTEHRAQILAQLSQEFGAETDAQDLIYFWWLGGAEEFSYATGARAPNEYPY